jgi:hypothetical protein
MLFRLENRFQPSAAHLSLAVGFRIALIQIALIDLVYY